jgi:protocatechuate 3,4-dioxygenase beta subunit
MKSFGHITMILLVLIACGSSSHFKSQIRVDKNINPATISGKVTIKGKGVAGIIVVASPANTGRFQPSPYQATTDQDGIYRISGIPPGSYNVSPAAPAFTVSSKSLGVLLIINEGESVENTDFVLAKGGVITGRVTNSEGRPVIEQEINVLTENGEDRNSTILNMAMRQSWVTDDRGVYRIFGVTPGKYKISVGQDGPRSFGRGSILRTFYPDVTDGSKAPIIEVAEGSELTGIDITVQTTEPEKKYAASGRIVDAVTGQPVSNQAIALELASANTRFSSRGFGPNENGQFRLENLTPGKYSLYVAPRPNTELRADPVPFEIIDEDISGLLLKTYRGASVSGQIVFEGSTEKPAPPKARQILLFVQVNNDNRMGNSSNGVNTSVRIGEDSTFHVGGLPSGTLNFFIGSMEGGPPKPFSILRLERDGMILSPGFEIKDGEQVTGLKLVVSSGNGTIRGMVKVQNGEIPPTGHISVWFTNFGADRARASMQMPSPLVDSRGHFVVEGLLPGTYELNAALYVQGSRSRPPSGKQQVTVTDGGVSEVTITIDLERQPEP